MRSLIFLRCGQLSRCTSRRTTSPSPHIKGTFSNSNTARPFAMFSSSNTFDPNTDVPDLSGRVFVVTGGSAGIGYGICAHLLQHNPAKLYLLGKKEEHLAEAEESLNKFTKSGSSKDVQDRVSFLQVELEDFHETDRVAKHLAADLEKAGARLDALVLNAGLGVGAYHETRDGLDSHMQVNVWAQFHLAMTLLPFLLRTPDSRLCLQSSDFHRMPNTSGIEFRDLAEMNTDLGASAQYNRSKLAQILLVHALGRRKQQGQLGLTPGGAPWINATHPGAVSTDQPEQAVEAYGALGKVGVTLVRPFMKDPVDQGCRPMLFAATSDKIVQDKIDGAYIVPDCKVTEPSTQSQDEALQERCWDLTVEVLKQKLGSLPYISAVGK